VLAGELAIGAPSPAERTDDVGVRRRRVDGRREHGKSLLEEGIDDAVLAVEPRVEPHGRDVGALCDPPDRQCVRAALFEQGLRRPQDRRFERVARGAMPRRHGRSVVENNVL